jgi:hypothetical protein
MRGRLRVIGCSLSLLLCVAVVLLWVSSIFIHIRTGWTVMHPNDTMYLRGVQLDLGDWSLDLQGETNALPSGRTEWHFDHWWSYGRNHGRILSRPRYNSGELNDGYGSYQRYLVVPLWMLTVIALPLTVPSTRLISRGWFYLRRRRDGLCLICGYNLNGNTSGVCPECGTPIAGKAGVTA